uniref:Solute carrier family 35 member F1 n=1 Tax=Anisakis simplex TaxID=6269 RepID=A0A0M3KAX4_ANISI
LCLCGTGVTSQLLTDHNVNTPAAQSFLNYFFLCSFYGTILVFKTGDNSLLPVIRKRGWKYFVLSLIDVEANYFIVYAYQFTNLTSIQLLDCSTIPMVLLLSWLFLSVRYLLTHIVGVCICLVGIAILIWADVLEGKGIPGGSNRLLGDIFCVIGSLLYATGNVGEEFFIKQTSRTEYLGMIGLFGSIISGIQLAALEHNELARVRWSGAIIGLYLLFAASMFVFYSLVAVVMQKASALMFNLSILTADFYTLLFGLFFFKYEFHALYFVSFAVVVSGSILYSLRPTQRRDSEEPRRVCPCCFWCLYWCCGCCCCNSCFEQNGSSRGSLDVGFDDVTPMPPASAGSTLPNSTSPIPLELAMYMQRFGGGVPGAGVGLAGGAVHYCPVHGASTATCSPSLNPTQLSAETRS